MVTVCQTGPRRSGAPRQRALQGSCQAAGMDCGRRWCRMWKVTEWYRIADDAHARSIVSPMTADARTALPRALRLGRSRTWLGQRAGLLVPVTAGYVLLYAAWLLLDW